MSLLMKALEKAAKDRGEAQPPAAPMPVTATTAAAAPGKTPAVELTLEPLQADAPAPAPESPPPPKAAAAAQARSSRNQARAATVMQASTGSTTAAATTRGPRIRPMMAFGLIGGVVLLALAIYVYLQITNPGLFIRRPTPTAPPPAPLAQAPQPQAPIATSAIVKPAASPTEPAAPAPVMAAPREPREPQRPAAAAMPASAKPAAEVPRNKIQISTGSAEPKTDNNLVQAYAALQSGKLDTARQYYSDAARNEPRNVNALLGLAAVAMQEGRTEDASRIYFDVLDLEPRNTYAQAGLIALMGRADPVSSEARLKQLIDRTPAASLHFTLGNLYADQSRWSEAQHAYFQAYQMESANPDYAYNLAVGLEHVGQPKLAANYYQRAVDQARVKGRAGFNPAQAQDRIRQLAAQPQ